MDEWSPPNPEYPPPKPGEPLLHRAARTGDHDEIRRLLKSGVDIDAPFDMGLYPGASESPMTPLMVAAGSGDGASASTVALLMELGADPRLILNATSAATAAFEGLGWNYRPGGDAARAKLLLEAGCPLPKHPQRRNRLLCDTAASGDAERLALLLAAGFRAAGYWDADESRESNLRARESMAEYRKSQPDLFASMPEEMRASIQDSLQDMEREMFDRMASAPSSFEIPLFRAAESGNPECVRALLAAAVDPWTRDNSGRTAMYHARSSGVVRALLDAGLPINDADEYGWSPLVAAVNEGESGLPTVRALIEGGADVNATHDRGYTVFMSAVGSGRHPEVLRLLVAAGADPHAVTEIRYNAFHAAIDVNFEANAEESVRDTLGYLKSLGVDLEFRNAMDQTPLARAIQEGTGLEVSVLCELGADPNAVCPKLECGGGECTRTELSLLFHTADGIGVDYDVKTRALLKAGADPIVKDSEGFTPLMHAAAALCKDAADYGASYQEFFRGLSELRLEGRPMPSTRDEFVAQATPFLQSYIERFAQHIPVQDTSEYAQQWRTQQLACITALAAYTGWAHHEYLKAGRS